MAKLNIRKSQSVNAYGPGNIVDFPGLSLMILSPNAQASSDNKNDTSWGYRNNIDNQIKIIDTRLANLFNVEYFVAPPLISENNNNANNYIYPAINAIRFPGTLFCPNCKSIHFVSSIEHQYGQDADKKNESFLCNNRPDCNNIKLVPMRFVIATAYGHIDDFPWDWYCHKDNRSMRGVCSQNSNNRHLKIRLGASASLSDIHITCVRCNAEQNLGSIFNQEKTFMDPEDPFLDYNSKLSIPWMGKSFFQNSSIYKYESAYKNHPDRRTILNKNNLYHFDLKEKLKNFYPLTLQRGAGNIYFPITHRGISLPEGIGDDQDPNSIYRRTEDLASRYIDFIIESPEFPDVYQNEDIGRKQFVDHVISFIKNNNAFLNRVNLSDRIEITKVLNDYRNQLNHNQLNIIDEGIKTRKVEYDCFLNPTIPTSKYYKSQIIDGQDYSEYGEIIDKVVLLHKIKQLNIHIGFTRVRPLAIDELKFVSITDAAAGYEEEFRRIRHTKSGIGTPWLPATEINGEGIFIKFKEERLNKWLEDYEQPINKRMKILSENYKKSLIQFGVINETMEAPKVDPRFVLLHTLSHILIEALSLNSGYNVASLSEIIYSDKGTSGIRMDGILIYTTTSDAEGTLGGLVAMGKPGKLEELFRQALEKSKWCSSDPLCISQDKGQGFMGLNMSACHSCCMIPETSCENINKFLDRGLLIGTIENSDMGFFV